MGTVTLSLVADIATIVAAIAGSLAALFAFLGHRRRSKSTESRVKRGKGIRFLLFWKRPEPEPEPEPDPPASVVPRGRLITRSSKTGRTVQLRLIDGGRSLKDALCAALRLLLEGMGAACRYLIGKPSNLGSLSKKPMA